MSYILVLTLTVYVGVGIVTVPTHYRTLDECKAVGELWKTFKGYKDFICLPIQR